MSVDVFGRNLERSGGSRGPPGVGFKVTSDGQYDMDNKRLTNVANPIQLNEAVNLETVYRIRSTDYQTLTSKISSLQSDLTELEKVKANTEEKLKNFAADIKTIKLLIARLSAKLGPIDLGTNEPEKNSTSREVFE